MTARFDDTKKKFIAMGRDREPALRVILARALGGLRTHGLPYFNPDKSIYLQAQCRHFRVWVRTQQNYVYLQIGYRIVYSNLHVRISSDGGGDLLDRRVSVIGWNRSVGSRQWQADLFDAFPREDAWLLNVPEKIFETKVVKAVKQQMQNFLWRKMRINTIKSSTFCALCTVIPERIQENFL